MPTRPLLVPEARTILDLAASDRRGAEAAMGALSPDAQVALVCEAPLAHRGRLLDLSPNPEAVVPLIPDAELCFVVKAVGLADAGWVLEHATGEQIQACIDLDAWKGTSPDRAALDEWMDALATTDDTTLLRGVQSLDPEMTVLYLKAHIDAELKPPRDDEDWEPPDGGKTLDGQFYYIPSSPTADITALERSLRVLFVEDYWTYFRMLQGVRWELPTENEEWALRWRTARLQDLGFPTWDEAMGIYRHMPAKERAVLPTGDALAVESWNLPVWMPQLPAQPDDQLAIFRALVALDPDERRPALYAFVALANKVAVADQMPLGDAESTPLAIEKAARFASDGLEHLAAATGADPVDIVRRAPLDRLFRIGANLDPESARPKLEIEEE